MDESTEFEFAEVVEDVITDETTETNEEVVEEVVDNNETEVQENELEVSEKPKDKNVQALDAERARRKKAEAEIKELKAKLEGKQIAELNEEKVNTERNNLKALLMKDDLIDEEVADRLMETFGNRLAADNVQSREKQEQESFDAQIESLMSDELFYDANQFKDSIKEYMNKGLDIQSAYFASAGKNKVMQMRKDLEVEAEQKVLNNMDKVSNIEVGSAEKSGEIKHSTYTKSEQRIANETGVNVKDVHKRMNMNTLDEFLNL